MSEIFKIIDSIQPSVEERRDAAEVTVNDNEPLEPEQKNSEIDKLIERDITPDISSDASKSVGNALSVNPDDAAKNKNAAAELEIEPGVIKQAPDIYRPAARKSEIDRLLQNSPVTQRHFSNPDKA